jgi:putative transcriptional regulator
MPGEIIKFKREQVGLTQNEMAEKLFMSVSAYNRIENRKTALRIDIAKRIAELLNCQMDELLPDYVYIDNAHIFDDITSDSEQFLKEFYTKIDNLKHWVAQEINILKSKG